MDPVIHFEIPYENAQRVADFYSAAFGWQTQLMGEDRGHYILATSVINDVNNLGQRGAINGGFYKRKEDTDGQHPSFVISVRHVRDSIKKVNDAGGKVLGDPMPIPGVGFYVAFIDSEGNRASMLESVPSS